MKNRTLPYFLTDILLCHAAVAIAYFIRFVSINTALSFEIFTSAYWANPYLWIYSFLNAFCIYIMGGYDFRYPPKQLTINTLVGVITASITMVLLVYLVGLERAGIFGRGILSSSILLTVLLASSMRQLFWGKEEHHSRKILLLIDGFHFNHFLNELVHDRFKNQFHFCLFKDKNSSISTGAPTEFKIPSIDNIGSLLIEPWDEIVASVDTLTDEQKRLLLKLRLAGKKVRSAVGFFESRYEKIPVSVVSEDWFLSVDGFNMLSNPIRARLKRAADFTLAFSMIALCFPILIIIAILIKLESKGPALYSQKRTGFGEHVFTLYKFRSMKTDAEADGKARWASEKDPRITKLGNFIRKTRIDELPQLWNVLKGEMSFVGPRPERPEFDQELVKLIPHYEKRFSVRPGLTGWAQINYPYGASVEDSKQKLQFDLYYIKNYSLRLDIDIFLRTVRVVVFGAGR